MYNTRCPKYHPISKHRPHLTKNKENLVKLSGFKTIITKLIFNSSFGYIQKIKETFASQVEDGKPPPPPKEVTQRSFSDLFLKDLATPAPRLPPTLPVPRGFTIRIGILQEPDYFPPDFSPSLLTRKYSLGEKEEIFLLFLEVHIF